jgi:acetoin utilization deacetylase AcuC-like enzyme
VLNDVAIAVRALRARGLVRRAAVIDLDVHQGNGTHAIFSDDEDTFTFSMHGRRNYPFRKVAGRLDVELEDGTGGRGIPHAPRWCTLRGARDGPRGPRVLPGRRRSA